MWVVGGTLTLPSRCASARMSAFTLHYPGVAPLRMSAFSEETTDKTLCWAPALALEQARTLHCLTSSRLASFYVLWKTLGELVVVVRRAVFGSRVLCSLLCISRSSWTVDYQVPASQKEGAVQACKHCDVQNVWKTESSTTMSCHRVCLLAWVARLVNAYLKFAISLAL